MKYRIIILVKRGNAAPEQIHQVTIQAEKPENEVIEAVDNALNFGKVTIW